MKNKWLSILTAVFGVAVLFAGCKKDDLGGDIEFYPGAKITVEMADSIIKFDSIRLSPLATQPAIKITVRAPQGINKVTLQLYQNNGTSLAPDLVAVGDPEIREFDLNTNNIVFTIPAGTISLDDNTKVIQVTALARYGAVRIFKKPLNWFYGGLPEIIFTDTNVSSTLGTADYVLKTKIASAIGLKSVVARAVQGAFDASDPDKLTYVGSASDNRVADSVGIQKRNINWTLLAAVQLTTVTGFEVTATDLLNRVSKKYIFREAVAAPAFAEFLTELPADFADGPYTLEGTVSSSASTLKSVKIETLAGSFDPGSGAPIVTGTTLVQNYSPVTNPAGQSIDLEITATTGQYGVRITATDTYGQVRTLDIFAAPPAAIDPPAIVFGVTALPTVFPKTGDTIRASITTEETLASVVVNRLVGTFADPTAATKTAVFTKSDFTTEQSYDLTQFCAAATGAIGVEIVATDNKGNVGTQRILAKNPASITITNLPYASATGEARGTANKGSNPVAWSLADRTGWDNTAATGTLGPVTVGGTDFRYYFVDFIFWTSVYVRESIGGIGNNISVNAKYGIVSPKAAQRIGLPTADIEVAGVNYKPGSYFPANDASWNYYNNTWFKLIGTTAGATPFNWDGITTGQQLYDLLVAADYASSFDATGNGLLEANINSGAGLKVGDVLLVVTDMNKKVAKGKGKLALMRVKELYNHRPLDVESDPVGKPGQGLWNCGETRLRFDLIMEND